MNNEIDREALLIYLNDLRTMETIVHEDQIKINGIYNKKNALYNNYLTMTKSSPQKPGMPQSADKSIATTYQVIAAIGILVCILYPKNNTEDILISVGGFICFVISALIPTILYRKKQNKLDDQYRLQMVKYENEKKKYNETVEKHKNAHDKYAADTTSCISEIQSEKNEINQKLQAAYSANIIPLQFRNIQGIYYLYDYISTSSQGLSEALMQCNLDAIRQQLNKVIQLQGETIIKQAQQNAALYEQNQQILEAAQATMNNTAIAAKYAQISAINSEMSLRLQRKNLAYQRADYWLK